MKTKGVGFGVTTIKLKAFLIELKHRNDKYDNEHTLGFELVEVPDLKDHSLTLNYLVTCVWALLENEYKAEGINQVFIYDKRGNDIIIRLAATVFTDEKPTHYTPPDESKFNSFKDNIKARIKKVYGASVETISYQRARLPCKTIIEYYDFYEKELCKNK